MSQEPFLTKLHLQNFKSFRNQTVEFNNPLFLVGKNGSGKSNFVEAISFLAECMEMPLRSVISNRGGLGNVGHISTPLDAPYIIIRADFVLPELGCYVEIGSTPVRRHRTDFVNEQNFKTGLRWAAARDRVSAILVLFDLDDDCARDLMPNLRRWASEEVAHLPHTIVIARREYEAWFVAAVESLRGVRQIASDATFSSDPELKRDAKGVISNFMPKDVPYTPTADQHALSAVFDFGQAYRRASSFRKLITELCRVLTELGHQPTVPVDWLSE